MTDRGDTSGAVEPSMPSAAAALFPPGVAVEAAPVSDLQEDLYPPEQHAIVGAAVRRRRTFVAGRTCARRALARLGAVQAAIPRGQDGAPAWPAGIVGSIAHTDDHCAAAAGWSESWTGLGLDVEDDGDLAPELWPVVLTRGEEAWLAGRSRPHRGRLAKLFFSAKEAAYKTQYPATRRFLDFHDVEVALDLEKMSFVAIVSGLDGGPAIRGRFGWSCGCVLAAAYLPRTRCGSRE